MVRTVDARSDAIVPNLTGFSVLDCATRQIFANSSGTRGPILSTIAWYFHAPTISLSHVPTGYVQPAVVSVSYSDVPLIRSVGYENQERPAMSKSRWKSPFVRMSSPASSWSLITVATASVCCSRKRTSARPVEYGRSRRLPVYQLGRGQDPVTVVGRIRSFVAVNMTSTPFDRNALCALRMNRCPVGVNVTQLWEAIQPCARAASSSDLYNRSTSSTSRSTA